VAAFTLFTRRSKSQAFESPCLLVDLLSVGIFTAYEGDVNMKQGFVIMLLYWNITTKAYI